METGRGGGGGKGRKREKGEGSGLIEGDRAGEDRHMELHIHVYTHI